MQQKCINRYFLVLSAVTRLNMLVSKTVIFVIFLQITLFLDDTYGQVNYTPETPLATQFEKYINYPVDHSTGAASIEVPLYTLKAGSIKIPINISYHTSGVKPSDQSLPIGLGWIINPGGRVTRKILGNPDEKLVKQAYQESISPYDLEYFQESENNPPSSNQTGNSVDADYDIFTYHTGTGVTGRFIIQRENDDYVAVPLVETHDRIKVHVVGSGSTSSIDYFEVTDATGTYYRFGKGLNNYSNSSASSMRESSGSAFTGWMLTDIISSDRVDTVSLIWKNVRNSVSNYYKQVDYQDRAVVTDQWTSTPFVNPLNSPIIGYKESPQFFYPISESYYLMNVIAGLRYKNEEIKFIYTNDFPTLLTRMEVHLSGTKFRQVDFHKSYFSNGATKLNSVSFLDKNNQQINSYHFGYNSLTWSSSPTRKVDYWGYYNGANNSTLVPNFSFAVFHTGGAFTVSHSQTDRDPVEGRTQASILNSITYPTGGKTTYEYEQNKIYDVGLDQILPVGGVRVKSISHWSAEGELAEKRTFVYGINESGAGDGLPMDTNMFTSTNMECGVYPSDQLHAVYGMYRKRIVTGSPLGSLFTFDFPAVTYRSVTEYIVDKNGNNSGKIVYNYSRVQYPLRSFAPSYDRYAYMGRYWDRARLLETIYYLNDQGTYKRVRAKTISYKLFETDTIKSWTFKRFTNFSSPSGSPFPDVVSLESNYSTYFPSLPSVFSFGNVYLYSGSVAPHKVRSVEYDRVTGDSVVVEKTYSYPNGEYLYPSSLTQINSNNKSSVTHFTYPKDYSVGTNPTNNVARGIKLLKDRNVMAPVIEEYTEVQPGNFVKSGKFTTYKTNQPKPESTFILKTISPPQSFNSSTITSSSHSKSPFYILDNQVVNYSLSGKPLEVSERDGIKRSYIWGYNDRYPIVNVTNAIYNDSGISSSSSESWTDAYFSEPAILGKTTGTLLSNLKVGSSHTATLSLYHLQTVLPGGGGVTDGTVTLIVKNSGGSTVVQRTFNSAQGLNDQTLTLSSGVYSLTFSKDADVEFFGNFHYKRLTESTNYSRVSEVEFENFEEHAGKLSSSTAHTGGYVYKGSYSLQLRDKIPGEYLLTYWSSSNGANWSKNEVPITVTSSSTSYSIGNSSTYIDDVRFHPKDAQMTTYTYDPLIGMTSQTDPAGQTATFEYDDFGRLETVRDPDGNVLQHHEYKYKQ